MTRSALALVLGLSMLSIVSCTKPQATNDEANETMAVVNGTEIKGKEILDKVRNDLDELKRQEYEIKRRAIEDAVQQHLLEDEAKKQGSTVDKLLSQFDSLKDKDVSQDDINAFLKERGIDEKKLSKQEKDSIPQIIKMQRVYEARQKYVAELRNKANVQIKLQRPVEKPVEVATGDYPPRGNPNAKVTVVEFSDFQCPFCARGRFRLDEISQKYGDKVRIFFRNFPLESIHPNAFHAAEAAACAKDQGKFWEFHNVLFDNQSKLDEKSLIGYAKDLGLDVAKFTDCLKNGKDTAVIRKDQEEGQKAGVNSTPTFFVNGHAIRGAQPIENFSEVIDEELAKH